MFTESLLEFPARARRGWITFLSFAVQTAAIAALVLLPLFYTQALPAIVNLGPTIGPPPGEAPRTAADERHSERKSKSEIIGTTVREPIRIPNSVANIQDESAPEPPAYGDITVAGGTGSRDSSTQIKSLLSAVVNPPAPTPAPGRRIPVSGGVSQGLLIQQVRPVYPPLAVTAHVQGAVVLNAVISRAGRIENLHVVSGHPLLVKAAVEAVQQWRYRPYLLNGEPVEIETQITVNFTLGGG